MLLLAYKIGVADLDLHEIAGSFFQKKSFPKTKTEITACVLCRYCFYGDILGVTIYSVYYCCFDFSPFFKEFF